MNLEKEQLDIIKSWIRIRNQTKCAFIVEWNKEEETGFIAFGNNRIEIPYSQRLDWMFFFKENDQYFTIEPNNCNHFVSSFLVYLNPNKRKPDIIDYINSK